MIAFLLFLLIFGMPSAFVGGILVQRRVGIDYKRRWQEALETTKNLIDEGIIEKKTVIERKVVHALPAGELSEDDRRLRRQLHKQAYFARERMEASRLRNGLPPVDDLDGLPYFAVERMVKFRYKFGYDDNGRQFRKLETENS